MISWCEEGIRADLVRVELAHDFDKEAQGGVGPESWIYKNELHSE